MMLLSEVLASSVDRSPEEETVYLLRGLSKKEQVQRWEPAEVYVKSPPFELFYYSKACDGL